MSVTSADLYTSNPRDCALVCRDCSVRAYSTSSLARVRKNGYAPLRHAHSPNNNILHSFLNFFESSSNCLSITFDLSFTPVVIGFSGTSINAWPKPWPEEGEVGDASVVVVVFSALGGFALGG